MIIKNLCCIILILSFLAPIIAKANEENEIKTSPIILIGAVETAFAINSWIASKEPNIYGATCLILFPFAVINTKNQVVLWTSLVASESLAFYNLMLDSKKHTESDIFKENMILWHILTGVVGISTLLTEDFFKNSSYIFTFSLEKTGGLQLGLKYKF